MTQLSKMLTINDCVRAYLNNLIYHEKTLGTRYEHAIRIVILSIEIYAECSKCDLTAGQNKLEIVKLYGRRNLKT